MIMSQTGQGHLLQVSVTHSYEKHECMTMVTCPCQLTVRSGGMLRKKESPLSSVSVLPHTLHIQVSDSLSSLKCKSE